MIPEREILLWRSVTKTKAVQKDIAPGSIWEVQRRQWTLIMTVWGRTWIEDVRARNHHQPLEVSGGNRLDINERIACPRCFVLGDDRWRRDVSVGWSRRRAGLNHAAEVPSCRDSSRKWQGFLLARLQTITKGRSQLVCWVVGL